MGNTMITCCNPVITIHNADGTILRHYKPPVFVKEILKESPDSYFVVSICKGRTAILASDLDLHPGGKYYLLPPDHFFSATSASQNIPISDHSCSCCYRVCAGLREAMARCSSKMYSTFIVNTGNTGLDWEKVGSICFPWKSPHTGSTGSDSREKVGSICFPWKSPHTGSTCSDSREKVGAIFIRTRKSPRTGKVTGSDWEKVVSICIPWRSTHTGDTGSDSREKVGSSCIPTKTPQAGNTGFDWEKIMSSVCIPRKSPQVENTCSDWQKVGSVCIPWKNPKTVEDDPCSLSREFSKEKWLEDMIRGADNQMRRLKLGQAFFVEDAGIYDDILEAKHWRFCLPSSTRTSTDRRSTSSAKNDQYLDTSLAVDGRKALSTQSMESSAEDISGKVALGYFQQLPKEDFHNGSGRRSPEIQSNIEHMDRPELERREDKNGRSSRRLKTDETERRSLLRSSPAVPSRPMFLQKFSTIDTSSRCGNSLNVDRG